eukprot:jgi/Ulvmu1/6618/UM003_0255.1
MRAFMSRRCAGAVVSANTNCNRLCAAKPTRNVRLQAGEGKPKSGHDAGSVPQPEIDEEFRKEIEAYKANEESAARLTPAEELRTLVECAKFGTISTLACAGPTKGYPMGSLLSYATDEEGRIICALSNLSSHKKDLVKDGRATVTVTQANFQSMADSRGTVTGTFETVPDEERAAARDAYMKVHPDAFWVDFGDFDFMRMTEVAGANLIGGFGRVCQITGADYTAAAADPVAQFSQPICTHMNDDHADATAAMVAHFVGMKVESAEMKSVDRLGITTQCRPVRASDQRVSIRLAFPEPADTRGAVKERLVAMTSAAAAAAKEAEAEATAA